MMKQKLRPLSVLRRMSLALRGRPAACIRTLSELGARVEAGDWAVRAAIDGPPELRSIAGALNTLLDRQDDLSARLRRSEAKWKFALEGAGDGVWEWDLRTGDMVLSDRGARMLGYETDEIGSRREAWEKLIHPEDLGGAQAGLRDYLQGGSAAYANEHRLLCKDGSWKWILCRGMQLCRDEAGRPLRMIGTHSDISKRKSAEASLLAAKVRFEATFDQAAVGIAHVDANGAFIRVNRRLCSILGYGEHELVGRIVKDFSHGADRDLTDELRARLLRGEIDTLSRNKRYVRKDGRVVWVNLTVSLVRSDSGEPLYDIAVFEDITESKMVALALSESEARFRGLTELSSDWYWEQDEHLRFVQLTAQFGDIDGIDVSKFIGKTRREVSGLVWDEPELTALEAICAARQPFRDYEIGRRYPNGSRHFMIMSGEPVFDKCGRYCGYRGTGTDITARKTAEEALRVANEQIKMLIQSSPLAIYTRDLEGRLMSWNPAAEAMYGWQASEVMGKPLPSVPGEMQLESEWLRMRILAGEKFVKHETRRRRRDGSPIDIDVYIGPLCDASGATSGIITVAADVTERKQAETARRALEAQLRESQKMEAMGTLAGGIAHDFNNHLAAILGNVVLAKAALSADHAARPSLEEIKNASKQAKRLVQQILAFSRKQTQEFATQSLRPLIEEARRLMSAMVPAVVSLDTVLPDGPIYANVDSTQVGQVLMNLCTNAWHAMQGGTGRIVISLDEVLLATAEAALNVRLPQGRYARIRVTDNGHGMDEATKARIFEPFFTTKEVNKGTGLGLSVVHGIVKAHNGSITVTSAVGNGTTFEVLLPAAQPSKAAPAPLAPPPPKSVRGVGGHVLYVDDKESLVLMVTRVLQLRGYRASGFASADEALEAVRTAEKGSTGDFDLVVTDFNMPGASGLDVAREVRRLRPDLPVVITSGYITEELQANAASAGVREVIQKQNMVSTLPALVDRLLAPHSAVGAANPTGREEPELA